VQAYSAPQIHTSKGRERKGREGQRGEGGGKGREGGWGFGLPKNFAMAPLMSRLGTEALLFRPNALNPDRAGAKSMQARCENAMTALVCMQSLTGQLM